MILLPLQESSVSKERRGRKIDACSPGDHTNFPSKKDHGGPRQRPNLINLDKE